MCNYGGNNASYSPGCDIFGASNGMVSQDILAHEFTHAVVHNEIGVPYQNEQGALDESLADTFAAFVDTANWTIGEGSPAGVIRTMSNPTLNGHPDRYSSAARVASVNNPNTGERLRRRAHQQRHPQQGRVPDHRWAKRLQHAQRARHGPRQGAAIVLQRAGESPARQQRFL